MTPTHLPAGPATPANSDTLEIPGVDFEDGDDAAGADVELPGVDDGEQTPQIVEIDDLDEPAPDPAPIELDGTLPEVPAPVVTPVQEPRITQIYASPNTGATLCPEYERLEVQLRSYSASDPRGAQS